MHQYSIYYYSVLCAYTCIGYITSVLEDAQVYSEHAQKKELDVSDVRLAIQNKMDHSFTAPPPRDVRHVEISMSNVRNCI